MATLTPLVPNGDRSVGAIILWNRGASAWTSTATAGSFAHIDETVGAIADGDTGIGLAATANTTVTTQFELTAVDSNFGSMDSISAHFDLAMQGTYGDDTGYVRATIFNNAGTALTDQIVLINWSGSAFTPGAPPRTNQTIAFTLTAAGLSATQADWNAAYLQLTFNDVKTKGSDGATFILADIRLTGTYTIGASSYDETGRQVSIVSTVTSTATSAMVEAKSFTATATVTSTDTMPAAAVGYITNTGASTSWVDTPDTDLADPTGDMELIVLVEPTDWTPASWLPLITKHNGSGDLGYLWQLRGTVDNFMKLEIYDATNVRVVNQDSNTVAVATAPRWFRVVYDADNGASQHVVSWYYSDDAPDTAIGSITWTALGVDTVAGAITSHPDTTAATMLMGTTFATENSYGAGKLYAASIKYGGAEVADPDFRVSTQTSDSGATFVDSYGNIWTNDYVWTAPPGSSNYSETGRQVSIVSTVTSTATSAMVEAKSFTATATVAASSALAVADTAAFTITSTVTSSDTFGLNETGAVSIASTVTSTDVAAGTVTAAVNITSTMSASDTATATESAVFTAVSSVASTDSVGLSESAAVTITSTVTGVALVALTDSSQFTITSTVNSVATAAFADASQFTITSTVTSTDVHDGGGTNYDETGRAISVTSTVTSGAILALTDSGLTTIVSTFAAVDAAAVAEQGLVSIGSTFGAVDRADAFEPTEVTIVGTFGRVDTLNAVDAGFVNLVATVGSEDASTRVEAFPITIFSFIGASDFQSGPPSAPSDVSQGGMRQRFDRNPRLERVG